MDALVYEDTSQAPRFQWHISVKILHVTSREFSGAPARIVLSLHRALIEQGHESNLLTSIRETEEPNVWLLGGEAEKGREIFRVLQERALDENPAHPFSSFFSLGYPGRSILHPLFQDADVIHLHDVKNLLSPATIGLLIQTGKRLVWSITDAWPFTGGCHCPVLCKNFEDTCSNCPQLQEDEIALPKEILSDKNANYGRGGFTVVCSNNWLATSAQKSAGLKGCSVQVIAPSVEPCVVNLTSKNIARSQLGLPAKAFVLLVQCEITGDQERGRQTVRDFLDTALHFNSFKRLARNGELVVIALGLIEGLSHPLIPVRCWTASNMNRLGLILTASDLAVFPRVEENSVSSIFECANYGTPVVAFDAMGISEHIQNEKTGLIIANGEINRMAEAVSFLALCPDKLLEWSAQCRTLAASQIDTAELARRYVDIYTSTVSDSLTEVREKTFSPPHFHQFCWNSIDSILADMPRRHLQTLQASNDSAQRFKKILVGALEKLALAERRLNRFCQNTETDKSDDFSKAFVSLQKLQGSLKKSLLNHERTKLTIKISQTNQLILFGEAPVEAILTPNFLPKILEKWLIRFMIPLLNRRGESGFGSLGHLPPRPIQRERFPKPTRQIRDLPSIAIVTPSFMQGHFIEKTIVSVTEQNYPKLRYAVQDAGSTDETVSILQKHAARITVWSSNPDTGQARAIREGFGKISGNVMAWLNSDDTLVSGSLNFVGEYFRSHPEVDAIYGHRIVINENDEEVGRWVLPPHDPDLLSLTDYVPQETLFWRAELWHRVDGIDPKFRFAMDWDLLLRFSRVGAKIVRVPYFLGCFRVHSEQKTSAVMNTIGAEEVTHLRLRTLGRLPHPAELGKVHRDARQRSALYEWLLKFGIRI